MVETRVIQLVGAFVAGNGVEPKFGAVGESEDGAHILVVLSALLLTWLLQTFHPDWLFAFPRHNPRFWALVCVAYPLVSVLPQGILYRALFMKRYAAGLPPGASLLLGALLFSWAHIVFHNVWACAFTFVGGLFFLTSYERTGSLLFSCIEHALYGDFLFTIGWGSCFYEGTQAAMRAVAP